MADRRSQQPGQRLTRADATGRQARLAAPWTLVLVSASLCSVAACSDDPESAGTGAAAELNPANLLLRSDTRGEDARAGVAFHVDCRAFRKQGAALGDEVPLPWLATVTVVDGPAGPLAVSGADVTLGAAGDYRVACRTLGGELIDGEGALVPVVAGPPASIETRLQVEGVEADTLLGGTPVKAGAEVSITCSGADAHGNPIDSGWSVLAKPEVTLPTANGASTLWQATVAGGYDLVCRVEGSLDSSPARLLVIANVPKHLHTLVDPPQIVAGNAAQLSCEARDAHGNLVLNFPFAIDHSDKLKLQGLYLSSTVAGLHLVRCVPETLDWALFTLHGVNLQVDPAAAAALLVAKIPDKGVYKRKETVKFAPTVRDGYGNIRKDDEVSRTVLTPEKGYKDKGAAGIQFNLDATYELKFQVKTAPNVVLPLKILVDGAPPLLTIDDPGWGTTLDGKPSVTVSGKAGDDGAGIAELLVNGKKGYPDALDQWKVQVAAAHGLTQVIATAKDLGGEISQAVRGFYYSGKYYPTDAATPKGALVDKALQVFLGREFFDDKDHNPSKLDDMATIFEVVAGAALKSNLIPANVNQGDIEVSLSNTKFGPLKVALDPIDGGLKCKFDLNGISTDLQVKAKLSLGPIKTTVKVSGDIQIQAVRLSTQLGVEVVNGFAKTSATQTDVQIDGLKLHVDGIGGLFDFLWNILLDSYKAQMEAQVVSMLEKELPKALQSAFDALAINQSFEVPPAIGKGKPVTVSLVSTVKTMTFSPIGALIQVDASFVASKGVPHSIKGSIGRDGCIGSSPDQFAVDTKQRLQFAVHDDFLNQLLYAMWYGGAFAVEAPLSELTGETTVSGFSLEGATLKLDFLLPPILEACNAADPMAMRLQVGDLFATIRLMFGSDPLDLQTVVMADAGLTLSFAAAANGDATLGVTLAKELSLKVHLQDITKGFQDQKQTFQNMIAGMITKSLSDGSLPLGETTLVPVPATVLDLSATLPGVPAGTALKVALTKLSRFGGYTALDFGLQ